MKRLLETLSGFESLEWAFELFGIYRSIEKALTAPLRVKELNLTVGFGENINVYAEDFLKFKNLKTLYIQTGLDHVPYIPEQIASLKDLRKLSVINVLFEELPEWVLGMSNLEYLKLRGHESTFLRASIGNMQNLEILRIENCELKLLPPEIKNLKKLRYLSLADTRVMELRLEHLPPNLEVLKIPCGTMDEAELNKAKDFVPSLKIFQMSVSCYRWGDSCAYPRGHAADSNSVK